MTDYAHTATANQNRAGKARQIASWCWDRGVGASELGACDTTAANRIAREAGVNTPSTETVVLAVDLLDQKEEWAAANPDAPAAARAGLDRPDWLPAAVTAPARPSLAVVPALPDHGEWVKPRGWDELAALGALSRIDAPCHVCGDRPVTITPRAGHCAAHPPQPGEWGAGLDWTPGPRIGACLSGACYCGRCAHFPRPPRMHLSVAS